MKTRRFDWLEEISEECIECELCRKECGFLQKYGNPKELASRFALAEEHDSVHPFDCNLCGLCAAVCPKKLNPQQMILNMRRVLVEEGGGIQRKHSTILNYEKRGRSPLFTFYGIPEACDTVLFPGCSLAGVRPETVFRLYSRLRELHPSLGVVLDCCAKPSHDLGRQGYFEGAFGSLCGRLRASGVTKILTACPSCYRVFKDYGKGFDVGTVYEVLAESGPGQQIERPGEAVAIHDACVVRFEDSIHSAVREIVRRKGCAVEEMAHRGKTALCCGEGGAACFVAPELAGTWPLLRKEEAGGRKTITYCAGCTSRLRKSGPTIHVLDLLFFPEAALSGKIKPSGSPFTYLNRILLKRRLKKSLRAANSRAGKS